MTTPTDTPILTIGYSAAFEIAIAFVLGEEGGYVDDPADKGGATCYGISQRAYPDINIETLTLEAAKAIYYQDYWLPCRCDQLPAAAACLVFDTAVNMGKVMAVWFLQHALRVTADGILGPVTLHAACVQAPLTYVSDYLSRRALRYHEIACKEDSQRRFVRGWLKRTYELQHYVYEAQLL